MNQTRNKIMGVLEKPELARPKVLMIEDDDDFRSLVQDWLASRYDVSTLSSGEDLIEEVEALEPDLIVLDVKLPGPDGFKLCEDIRGDARFKDIPILFLTGLKEDADFLKSLRAGGTAYLLKPISRRQLLARVQEELGAPR